MVFFVLGEEEGQAPAGDLLEAAPGSLTLGGSQGILGVGKGVGEDGVSRVLALAERLGGAVCATREVTDGPLDTSLDFKWRFFERGALSLGLKPGITLPTGDDERGLGAGKPTWGALFIGSYQPAGAFAFHSHLGYRRFRNTLGWRESLAHVSGAVVYSASEKLRLVADVSADTNPLPSSYGTLRYTVLGLSYSASADLDLDAGVKFRLNGIVFDRSLLFGVTLRW